MILWFHFFAIKECDELPCICIFYMHVPLITKDKSLEAEPWVRGYIHSVNVFDTKCQIAMYE